ncbi:1,4-dihydroxy-2-naphthoate polyprenyltransferase [Halonotius terrestris]|uniref:1,4-dihydroxy-2-naphthoate octaprenyltransferase n=1 Tax=Halonotius terrestris TaxID=2487750 RepID=A0A8J8PA92_9EURY|nr:1,4-dihydroxy-2-naphthoate polyprenyltransferase [Halonotius terrestris]TQQ82660.1 1,4-dihydroxy-2-naphthoate polyprenyltransferase [Halonotius terrestris]
MSGSNLSRTQAWVAAARPQTLPAAAAPVIVGVGLAVNDGVFAPLPAVAAFIGAALIQIGTNFANDYYDAIQGADTDDREGFTRVTQSGLIEPGRVKAAMYLTFAAAVVVGSYLVYIGGVPILIIGLLSVVSGIAYTGGPYPLGYHGLGDLFVFVFFGVIAVTGTYYVQAAAVLAAPLATTIPAGTVTLEAFVASLPIAAISTNILVVNNIRDKAEDETTGKRTLAVRFGYSFSRAEYIGLFGLAYLVPVWLWLATDFSTTVLLPLLTLPIAARVAETVRTETSGAALNPALETTGKLLAGYALLFGVGLGL